MIVVYTINYYNNLYQVWQCVSGRWARYKLIQAKLSPHYKPFTTPLPYHFHWYTQHYMNLIKLVLLIITIRQI